MVMSYLALCEVDHSARNLIFAQMGAHQARHFSAWQLMNHKRHRDIISLAHAASQCRVILPSAH